ncbi:hypothetical protein [Nocardiopsis sp. NPDC006832]|uniref:hypothetical protein n=1 Tax=Nocardiopsis sp. NPDC006832 TaxID=3157188 RepID=UPI0033C562D3
MSETSSNPLGVFLRARRELVTPTQAGIPECGVRRVLGLRRRRRTGSRCAPLLTSRRGPGLYGQ